MQSNQINRTDNITVFLRLLKWDNFSGRNIPGELLRETPNFRDNGLAPLLEKAVQTRPLHPPKFSSPLYYEYLFIFNKTQIFARFPCGSGTPGCALHCIETRSLGEAQQTSCCWKIRSFVHKSDKQTVGVHYTPRTGTNPEK